MGNYSSGDVAALPGTSADLSHIYDATDLTNVGTDDTNYVDQTGSSGYELHQYKDSITATSASVTWKGKSSLAPSSSKVQLQVYNVTGTAWEDVSGAGASNNVAAADTDFTLSGTIATANYLDSGVTTFRIYQAASATTWPVAGVTAPTHWYPFYSTGDYTDHGSAAALDLSAEGSGNTFSSGLVLNGSGSATHTTHADLCNIGGGPYSVLIDFISTTAQYSGVVDVSDWVTWPTLASGYRLELDSSTPQLGAFRTTAGYVATGGLTVSNRYHIVLASDGSTNVQLYINGSFVDGTINYSIGDNSFPFRVGTGFTSGDSTYRRFIGTIKQVGILKGTEWSSGNVSSIWTAFSGI